MKGRVERDAGEAAAPGTRWQSGGRSVRLTAYGRTLVEGLSVKLWKPRTIVSHPKEPREAEAGVGTVKKHHAKGANRRANAHSRRSVGGSRGRLDACSQEETGATGPTRSEGSGTEVEQRGGALRSP